MLHLRNDKSGELAAAEQLITLLGSSDESAIIARKKTDTQITEFMTETNRLLEEASQRERELRSRLTTAESQSAELVFVHNKERSLQEQRIAELERALAASQKQLLDQARELEAVKIAAAAEKAQAIQTATESTQKAADARVALAVQEGQIKVDAMELKGTKNLERKVESIKSTVLCFFERDLIGAFGRPGHLYRPSTQALVCFSCDHAEILRLKLEEFKVFLSNMQRY